ncbi:retrovirus-related pol polyprotein from transposon TNT 1-94 [Tanacetum coccineum]
MISGSIFSKQYWTEAVATACYTQNRSTIVKRHFQTPYETFRKRIPNINFLHVFGCPVYIHNHKDHLGKFDEKADDGYLLGYSLVSKAFRVFNTRRQQTKETYHIIFDESPDAIKFSKPSIDNINIAENERYQPDFIFLFREQKARILELKRRYFEDYCSDNQYAVSIKEDTAYPCLHSPKTTKETISIRRSAPRLCPYHFTYPERKLTMVEMLYKFIDEGKREHEEMRAFICDFQTTNKILFKERNISLIKLRFGVQKLLKVINNTPMIDCEVKGVTTRGGKTTTQDAQNNDNSVHTEEPHAVNHDEPVESDEVLTNNQPQKTSEPVAQPSNKIQAPPIPFPRRLRKEKEEAQQKKFLENLKQLYINLPFIEALAQMPKYAKFLKGLLTNKARLKEAYMITMNKRCSTVLLNKLPSKVMKF